MVVYGDYDVDGITATCTLVDYLRSKGAKCEYYIPNRLTDGYGLTRPAMEQLYEQGTRLLITVDSGITANEEIAVARELGMQVVITDHHECHENLPDAQAVVDCKRTDDTYPFSSLAGVGVAFKLICALEGDTLSMLDRYADLVALGTVADVMPIVGENRIIVAEGLKKLSVTANIGLEMLLREAGMNKSMIRELSHGLGLPTWNKQSFACLSSRFVYGEEITEERLGMVDRAEQLLLDAGFHQVRVRIHESGTNTIARIEIGTEDFAKMFADDFYQKVNAACKEIGFTYVTLDLGGYRMGSMNDGIRKA